MDWTMPQFDGEVPSKNAMESELAWIEEEVHLVSAEYHNSEQAAAAHFNAARGKMCHALGVLEFYSYLASVSCCSSQLRCSRPHHCLNRCSAVHG